MTDGDFLYVIVPHFNLLKFKNCEDNLDRFLKASYLYDRIKIVLVEGYYEEEKQLPDLSDKVFKHVKIKLKDVLWSKENLINIGFKNLPSNWKYGSWVDRDIFFTNFNWAVETIEKLKTCDIMQPWSECICLTKNYKVDEECFGLKTRKDMKEKNESRIFHGFCKSVKLFNRFKHDRFSIHVPVYLEKCLTIPYPLIGEIGFPGHAWAITRDFYEKINGLIDICILGESDRIIAKAIVQQKTNDVIFELYKNKLPEYLKVLFEYFKGFENVKIDYLDNVILHYYHGTNENRNYGKRRDILLDFKYDPKKHIRYDERGVLEYTEEGKVMEQSVKDYFISRKEDE
jgi:hypothetical protein